MREWYSQSCYEMFALCNELWNDFDGCQKRFRVAFTMDRLWNHVSVNIQPNPIALLAFTMLYRQKNERKVAGDDFRRAKNPETAAFRRKFDRWRE